MMMMMMILFEARNVDSGSASNPLSASVLSSSIVDLSRCPQLTKLFFITLADLIQTQRDATRRVNLR